MATVPFGVVNMILGTCTCHAVFERIQEGETLNVGSVFFISETGAPLGHVDGYFFGSVTRPGYVVRLDPNIQLTDNSVLEVFVDEAFAEYIDEEELYQRFHDPVRKEFDIFDQGEVIDCDTKSNLYDSQLQYHHYMSSQTREPNLGPQVSTLFASDQNYFNQQPFGMHQQHSLNSAALMAYNQQQQNMINQQDQIMDLQQQYMINQQNQMMNLQQYLSGQISTILQGGGWSGSHGGDMNYSNQQQFGLPQPMQFQMFHAGTSSYRGRRRRRSRARGRERRGQD